MINDILIFPSNTEKSMSLTGTNVYVFIVSLKATKKNIKDSIEKFFQVKVAKVNVANVKGKSKIFRGHLGNLSSFKKAFVTISEGSINFDSGF